MGLLTIEDVRSVAAEQRGEWLRLLEAGNILFFPRSPIALEAGDVSFLLGQQQADTSLHKNIAYKPARDVLTGVDTRTANGASVARLHGIMSGYSHQVEAFLREWMEPYNGKWRLDYASFRPQEEQNRDLPRRRRNDLLHTDAFPTRPTRGARILRFFTHIHPERTRDWVVGEPFAHMVRAFVPGALSPRVDSAMVRAIKRVGQAAGLAAALPALKRTPYDDFMMRLHNHLKEDERFQAESPREAIAFPAGSSWMVYTDTVPHAVLAGQYALEQTVLVEPGALLVPEHAPLRVLEQLAGQSLV